MSKAISVVASGHCHATV